VRINNHISGQLKIFEMRKIFKSIEVLNIIGEKIHYFASGNLQANYEIDLSDVPKVVYFVKINDGIRDYNKKIVTY